MGHGSHLLQRSFEMAAVARAISLTLTLSTQLLGTWVTSPSAQALSLHGEFES